jgi:hypothetical protein
MRMISDKLVALVERRHDEIVKSWLEKIKLDPATTSYQRNIGYLCEKAKYILSHIDRWVSYDTMREDVGRRYAAEGMELFKMQIPLCEVIRSMYLLRRTLWLFVVNERDFDSGLELHQLSELNDRVILFFDRAEYYVIRGYMEELNRKIKALWSLKQEDTEKIFFTNSFYKQ